MPFAVQYTFESGLPVGHELTLVVERPDEFCISVNGTAVEHDDGDGYWLDTTFRRIPIGTLAQARHELDYVGGRDKSRHGDRSLLHNWRIWR